MKLARAEYEVENYVPIVYLFCRENGKRVIRKTTDLVPYFYVPIKESNRLNLRQDPNPHTTIYGDKVAKVYTTLPSDVPQYRDRFSQSFEADVLFPIRYMVDMPEELEPCSPSVMFLDIETDSSGRVPDPTLAPEEVLCVSVFSNNSYTTFVWRQDFAPGKASRISWDTVHEVIYFKTEEEMLTSLIDFIASEEPDVISGWNVDLFDLTYLINRMRRLGLDYTKMSPMGKVYIDEKYGTVTIKGVAVVDLLAAYRRFAQWTQGLKESYTLDFIGKEVAGIGKAGEGSNVKWMWNYDIEHLIEYNCTDVRICLEINRKQLLLEFMDELRRICYCHLEDCMSMTKMADSYILRLFHNRMIFPTRSHHERHEYEGAIVESWAAGIYQDVAVFDIRSLYPSIIVSARLSPESMRDKAETGTIQLGKYHVRQDINGYLPEVISHLFKERAKYKNLRSQQTYDSELYKLYNLRQEALKRLLNALYGQTAYPNSRLYDARVAETITWMGRQIIMWSKEYVENMGYKVIYIDTDGMHIWFDEFNLELFNTVLGLLNSSYDTFTAEKGLTGHIFEMEFQKVYHKVFYGAGVKKRYAGAVCYREGKEEDYLDVWGFEIKRSDASQFTRNLQKRVFDMILREDKSKEDVMRYVGDEIDRIRKGNFKFTEIGIPKGMTRDPLDYFKSSFDPNLPTWKQKGISANIRGVLYAMKVLKHTISPKPKMIYVSSMANGYEPIDVLCFDDDKQVPPGTQIDVEKTLDKTVKAKLESIFEGIGWKMSDLSPWWKGKPNKKEGDKIEMFNLSAYEVPGLKTDKIRKGPKKYT